MKNVKDVRKSVGWKDVYDIYYLVTSNCKMFSLNHFPSTDSIAYWLRYSIREWQVKGSKPSSDSGVSSGRAGWVAAG